MKKVVLIILAGAGLVFGVGCTSTAPQATYPINTTTVGAPGLQTNLAPPK